MNAVDQLSSFCSKFLPSGKKLAAVRFSVLALLCVVLVGGASAGIIEEYNIAGLSESSSETDDSGNNRGVRINPNKDVYLKEIDVFSADEDESGTVYVEGGSVSESVSYNGEDKVSFNSILLKKGTNYDIYFSGSANYVGVSGYPYEYDFIDVVNGVYGCDSGCSTFDAVYFFYKIKVESANEIPQFNSSSIDPDPVLIGENVSYSAEVYDSDGSVDYTNLTVQYGGSTVLSDEQRTGTNSPVWNDVFTPQTGNKWLNATLSVVDDQGAVTTKEINRYLEDSKPNVTINKPDSSIKDSNTVEWNVSTEERDSDPNEALDLKIYKNGNLENTYSITEGDTKTGSLTYSDGTDQTFKAEAVETDGKTDSETSTFDVDTTPPQISIDSPSGDLDRKKNLDLNYSIDEPHLDSSTCEYSKDGGARFSISNCENTTVTFNTVGQHNLTVYAEDTLGFQGSSTTEFTTDYENRISLEDSVSSAEIQDFEVTFSNGSATAGGSTSDGQFEILTSKLPRGSVEMTLEADGYKIRNESLSVDDSFELRNTYGMDRASFSLDAFSEIDQSDLNFNFTASNGTTSFTKEDISSFEKEYRDFDSIGFPTGDVRITVQDVESQHYRRAFFADLTENSVISLDAYLLEKGQGILTNIEVRNPQNENLNNALVSIQRNINNSYRSVTQGRSASDGSASFYLSPDTSYKILVSHPQYNTFSGTFNPANYQYDALIVQLGEDNDLVESTTWDGLEYDLDPDQTKLNATGEYSFNWSVVDPEAGITGFGVRVKNSSGSVLEQTSVTGSPSGGTASLVFNISNSSFSSGDELLVEAYFVKDQSEFRYQRSYNVFDRVSPGIFSLKTLMGDFESGTSSTAQSFVALIVTLMVGTGLKSRFNRAGAGMVSLLVLGMFTFAGWFSGFFWLMTALALIGMLGRRG